MVQSMTYSQRTNSYTNTQVCVSSSVGELTDEDQILLYPNPTTDELFIDLSTVSGQVECILYSVDGKLLKQEVLQGSTVRQLRVGDLDSGVYTLTITSGNKQITRKVILNDN